MLEKRESGRAVMERTRVTVTVTDAKPLLPSSLSVTYLGTDA